MEFTLMPNHLKISMVMAKDSGIAISVMKVVRKFSRKRKRTMVTMIAPSRMASLRLPMAWSMKSLCWKSSVVSTPAGRWARVPSSALFDLLGERAGVEARSLGDGHDDAVGRRFSPG